MPRSFLPLLPQSFASSVEIRVLLDLFRVSGGTRYWRDVLSDEDAAAALSAVVFIFEDDVASAVVFCFCFSYCFGSGAPATSHQILDRAPLMLQGSGFGAYHFVVSFRPSVMLHHCLVLFTPDEPRDDNEEQPDEEDDRAYRRCDEILGLAQ